MKLFSKYEELNKEYNDYIVLIKSGIFYITFSNDALIINSITNYLIKNNKLGFPISSIEKVKEKLNECHINYIIVDEKNTKFNFEDNKYKDYIKIINKNEYKNKMKKILFDRIEYLINEDDENYNKIRNFIDEL